MHPPSLIPLHSSTPLTRSGTPDLSPVHCLRFLPVEDFSQLWVEGIIYIPSFEMRATCGQKEVAVRTAERLTVQEGESYRRRR